MDSFCRLIRHSAGYRSTAPLCPAHGSYGYKGCDSLPDCTPDYLCAPPLYQSSWLRCLDLPAMATITHYDSTLGAGFIGCLFTAMYVSS